MRHWTARTTRALGLLGAVAGAACSGQTAAPTSMPPRVFSVTVSPASFTVAPGGRQQLTATVSADPGADTTVVWSSSDPNAITFSATGGAQGLDSVSTRAFGGAAAPSLSTTTQVAIIGGGAAAGAYVVTATAKADPTVSGKSTATVTGVDLTPLFGTFNISATKSSDTGCNFAQSFTGQLQLSSPSKDGSDVTAKMIETLTRIYSGTMATSGAYTATGTGNLNGFIYSGTLSGSVTNGGASTSGTETLNFTAGCPGRVVIYQFTGTK
jgi:hypothetical protein